MKKLLVLGMALILASNVFADNDTGKDGKRNPDRKGTEMREHRRGDFAQLNLTEEQKSKMKALREKHQAEMHSMREKHRLDIKAVMTTEQWAKFEQMKAERPKGGDRKGGNRQRDDEYDKQQ